MNTSAVVVAVRRRGEPGRQPHDLRVEAGVALREEPARRALTARLGRGVGVGAGRDRHVPLGLVEAVDAVNA